MSGECEICGEHTLQCTCGDETINPFCEKKGQVNDIYNLFSDIRNYRNHR